MNADRLMRNMMQGMGMGMPFGDPFDDLMGGGGTMTAHQRQVPFSMMGHGGMSLMNPMSMMMMNPFQSMQQAMSMAQNGSSNGGFSYCSSSVTSYTTDEHGRPQVYQRSNEVKQGPNGLRETKSSLRDSRTGQQELAIGHHLRDKARIKKRSKNVYTGEEEQAEDLVNLDESEAETFENTWREQARSACTFNQLAYAGPGSEPSSSSRNNRLALAAEPHRYDGTDQSQSQPRYQTTPKHSLNLASKLFKKDKKKKKTSGGGGANSRDEKHK